MAILKGMVVVPFDFGPIHEDIVNKRTKNTGKSFKLKEESQSWMDGSKRVLWITGGRE